MNAFTTQLSLFFHPKYLIATLALSGTAAALVLWFGSHQVNVIELQQNSMQPLELIIREMVANIYQIVAIGVFFIVVDCMWKYLGKRLRDHGVV